MDKQAIEAILHAVRRPPERLNVEGASPLAVIPDGYKIQNLREFLIDPDVLKQRVDVLTADAFLAYWGKFKLPESVVFADERTATYTALFDYHESNGEPGRCLHRVVYAAPKAPEWLTWTALDRKRIGQAEFAEFIEENYVDVLEPSHAEMIQISMNLQVKKGLAFGQSTRLSDGQVQLTYNEEISGTVQTQAGSIKVPESFTLQLPVFLGGPRYPLKALLRYRISGGQLQIGFDLHRPQKVVESATTAVTEAIRKGLDAAPLFLGAPA
jgi:uncharacterized protein YfdQ (DUF2303 family)